jgi:hypothetical protein
MTTENEKCVSTLNETNKLKRYTLFLESDCDIPEKMTIDAPDYFHAYEQCASHLGENYGVGDDDFAVEDHKEEEVMQ